MFPPTSRYAKAATYQARTPDRRVVAALVIPAPRFPPPLGYHPRAVGDRLDLIAQHYLNDPTGFWRLVRREQRARRRRSRAACADRRARR